MSWLTFGRRRANNEQAGDKRPRPGELEATAAPEIVQAAEALTSAADELRRAARVMRESELERRAIYRTRWPYGPPDEGERT